MSVESRRKAHSASAPSSEELRLLANSRIGDVLINVGAGGLLISALFLFGINALLHQAGAGVTPSFAAGGLLGLMWTLLLRLNPVHFGYRVGPPVGGPSPRDRMLMDMVKQWRRRWLVVTAAAAYVGAVALYGLSIGAGYRAPDVGDHVSMFIFAVLSTFGLTLGVQYLDVHWTWRKHYRSKSVSP